MYSPKARYGLADTNHIDMRLVSDARYARREELLTNITYAFAGLCAAGAIIIAYVLFV